MSLSDLASLSKVMELPDGPVEYGRICTDLNYFWDENLICGPLKILKNHLSEGFMRKRGNISKID